MQTSTDKNFNKESGAAQIHRFGDKVAVHLPNQETVYMTKDEACDLSRLLFRASADIEENSFVNSKFPTSHTIQSDGL